MEFDLKMLSVSHGFKKHPLLKESLAYKIKYLNILEYFVNKYSKEDEFSLNILKNYKDVFLGKAMKQYSYDEQELKKFSKASTGEKFKGFKLFEYRYALLYDCLFINAMGNRSKANKILIEIKSIYSKKYYKRLDILFDVLYKNEKSARGFDEIKYQIKCWKNNEIYLKKKQLKILVTANMSAGKSTLINTIVGKKISSTMNDSCTSKLHYIYDKAFEDGFSYKLDGNLNLNVDEKQILENNKANNSNKVFIATYFDLITAKESKLCLIDTPGVNSYMDSEHSEITKNTILNEEYDKLLYLVNAENAGTDDDLKYLNFICNNVDENKIIFVLNKLDKFKMPDDSIEDSINNFKNDLLKIGIKNLIICPISSYAGLLGKKKIFGNELNEDEEDDYILLERKFKNENYNLSKFYSNKTLKNINEKNSGEKRNKNIELLKNCGVFYLEEIIIKGVKK